MKRRFYPIVKHSARWSLMAVLLMASIMILVCVLTQKIVDLPKLMSFMFYGGAPITLLCVSAALFTIAAGALEHERSKQRKFLNAKSSNNLRNGDNNPDFAIESQIDNGFLPCGLLTNQKKFSLLRAERPKQISTHLDKSAPQGPDSNAGEPM